MAPSYLVIILSLNKILHNIQILNERKLINFNFQNYKSFIEIRHKSNKITFLVYHYTIINFFYSQARFLIFL